MTFSKGNVIPSQCAHWRGNPLNRRGLPRRFAPRNDKYNLPRCVILSAAKNPFSHLDIYGSFDSGFAVAQDDNGSALVSFVGHCQIARFASPTRSQHLQKGFQPVKAGF